MKSVGKSENSPPLVCTHLGFTPCVWGTADTFAFLDLGNIALTRAE